ncbi:MAG: flagellar basal body L-ring protein FlgH [Pseudomonadota bacterium]
MKKFTVIKQIFIISTILLMASCGNYVSKVHRQMDRETKQGVYQDDKSFSLYRKGNQNKFVSDNKPSSKDMKTILPEIQRQYKPAEEAKKRYTAKDLYDNSQNGSLWAGEGSDTYLFSENRKKQSGDIVVVNVMTNLKEQIAMELKKAFPPNKPNAKKDEKSASGKEEGGKKEAAPAGKAEGLAMGGNADDGQVFDRISSVVVEEISADHLLLRGRKDLVFNDIKRTVELQALVPRKSVNYDDTVNSSNVLESHVVVIR